jgi:hypothetical protein
MSSPQPPPDLPPPPDQAQWDAAAVTFQLNLLTAVQTSAGVWGTAVASLLGLFGSVALLTGPTDITKIGSFWQPLVLALTALAGLLAAISLIVIAQIQQVPHLHSTNWNGDAYRVYVLKNAAGVRANLQCARWLGFGAAALVFTVGMIALIYAATQTS